MAAAPHKTIYMRDGDRDMWAKADELAGDSLAGFVADAVRAKVMRMGERATDGRIEVEVGDDDERRWINTFRGEWLIHPDDDAARTAEEGYDAGAAWGVALTAKGNIAVYVQHVNDRWPPKLDVYPRLADADLPADVFAKVAVELGETPVIELDI